MTFLLHAGALPCFSSQHVGQASLAYTRGTMAVTRCITWSLVDPLFLGNDRLRPVCKMWGGQGPSSTCRYTFHNQWMLRLALVHSSAFPVPGTPCSSGIHLAWIGDSALNLIVTEQLMAAYSSSSMGELSAARSRLVSREMCKRWGNHYLACAQSIQSP